jgi:Zn-dependent protease/predicted transcriptional regulator
MRGSLKIFTWFNIPVYIHWTFSLIIFYFMWLGFQESGTLAGIIESTGLLIALFTCVLLHEFGHSLMARKYSIDTQDIILTPIGGIARLEKMPEKPQQELLVAIAGPMVNVIIALLIFVGASIILFNDAIGWWYFQNAITEWSSFGAGDPDITTMLDNMEGTIPVWQKMLPQLLFLNIMMVVFNLIPAFPMDGGRVLRALIAMQAGRLKATMVAARVGQAIAILFVVVGIYFNAFTMALIGFFVFTTARTEYAMVRLEEILKNHTAGAVVRRQFTQMLANDWMQSPIELLTRGQEHHFLVFDMHQQLIGYLTEKKIIEAAKRKDMAVEIQQYMEQPAVSVTERDSLRYIYFLVTQRNMNIVAVKNDHGAIIGVIDLNGLESFLKING